VQRRGPVEKRRPGCKFFWGEEFFFQPKSSVGG